MSRSVAIFCVASLLAGCASEPLRDVPRLSDVAVADDDPRAAMRTEDDIDGDGTTPGGGTGRGFLARLLGGPAQPDPAEEGADDAPPDDSTVATGQPDPAIAEAPRGGLLGFLGRAAQSARTDDSTRMAAAPPMTQDDTAPVAPAGGPGPDAPDYRIVPVGTVLPYGQLARVCDVPSRQLGTRVERYPETRAVYTLHDSEPGNTAPHTFYLTGFDDGCARQFTAALAMFGSAETHERLRYGLPSQVQPYSTTDAAYEMLKSRVCRVAKGKPCGSAMSRLSQDTAFVSVYETFGSNPEWKTILLHGGEVVETDIRGN